MIEGARELSLALQSGYKVESVYVCYEMFEKSKYPDILKSLPGNNIFDISLQVFGKIAYRENSDGIVAIAKPKHHRLCDIHLSSNPFVILLESVEKPGNLGAVLRTADAAAVDAVIVCDPQTDLYNPNVIRSGGVGGASLPCRRPPALPKRHLHGCRRIISVLMQQNYRLLIFTKI